MNLYLSFNLIYSPQFNKYKPLIYITQLHEKNKLSGVAGERNRTFVSIET